MNIKVYDFWIGGRKYQTKSDRLTGKEIKEISDSPRLYPLFQDSFRHGSDVEIGDGVAVSVVGEPHFYCAPPATI